MDELPKRKHKRNKQIPKPTDFGKNLRFLRKWRRLSQSALAEELGITRNKIASYESGLVEPPAFQFIKVCRYFNIAPNIMLEGLLSEETIQNINLDMKEITASDYVSEKISTFIYQTNEMTKIYEGYKLLYDTNISAEKPNEQKVLVATIKDLLDLLNTLIKSNWKLIQSATPEEE